MQVPFSLDNTLTRKKEVFEPLQPPFVGMYVCGPTVYSNVHLGNVRTFLTFDILYRYLQYQGYKVRYVRNITDVGHLENDVDEGEDKIAKRHAWSNSSPWKLCSGIPTTSMRCSTSLTCCRPVWNLLLPVILLNR